MDILIQKFRKNDLVDDNGKQIEFSAKQVKDFFDFQEETENFTLVYKACEEISNKLDGTTLKQKATKSSERGDYKIYGATNVDKNLKRFLLDDLGLNDIEQINDFFVLKKIKKCVFEFSWVPLSSDLGNFFQKQSYSGKVMSIEDDSIISENDNNFSFPIIHKQIIFYGVPGCGKSYSIDKELDSLGLTTEKLKESNSARVVFHPEYTNSDFIGQILPKVEGDKVKYVFTAGAFAKILRKAYEKPNKNFALIIEEINRGNAAAIFGEVFQLLDRLEVEKDGYSAGWSSYSIDNENLNAYIYGAYDKDYKVPENGVEPSKQIGNVNFSRNTGIRLPPNLSLFATMNTSDQNVFKLDNAFKRRWNLKMIPNEFDLNDEKQRNQCNAKVDGFDFTWGEFRLAVNKLITEDSDSNSFSDKQLGTWFVKNVEGKISSELFANKVLEYLWDDVFNFETEKLFKSDYKTLASVIGDIGKGIEIFNDKFKISIENARKEINEKLGIDATN